jgi:RNA polymerase sigma factor (sigma-70 family)
VFGIGLCIRNQIGKEHRKTKFELQFDTDVVEQCVARQPKERIDITEFIDDDEDGQLFKSHYIDKISYVKLAERLGVTRQRVQQRVKRAAEKIKSRIYQ